MISIKWPKKKKRTETQHPTAASVGAASTSANATEPANDNFTKINAIQNAGKLFEVLESVGEASDLLSPLKAVCGVLRIATEMALLLHKNGEDLQDLVEKLKQQRKSIEQEIDELSSPEFSKLRDIKGLVHPLEQYASDLKSIYDTLAIIEGRYKHPERMQRFKTKLKAQSDQDQIADCTRKLDSSFQQLTSSVTKFIARQVVLMRDEVAALHQNIAEMTVGMAQKDAKDALSRLFYVNAHGNQHDSCTEGTRVDMLDKISRWASDVNAEPMIALVDQAGTGKSTIAAHMTQKWEKDGSLLARFFFSKPSTVTGNGVATTLARDIAESVPSLGPLIVEVVEKHPNYIACSLQQQLEWLVFTPLKSLKAQHILVIDALDECSKADRAVLLKSTLDFITDFDAGLCPLRVLLTSRPEDDIISRIHEPCYAKSIHRVNFLLHSKENTSNEDDIRVYITRAFSNCLAPEQCELLVKKANGLFIWASTAQAFITNALDPMARFEKLMEKDSSLNTLYDDVLNVALESAGDEKETVTKVLQAICVARELLTTEAMDELLELRSGIAQRVVIKLSSVLSGGSDGAAIYALHPTFLEYLQGALKDPPIVTIPEAEALMAKGCSKVLLNGLKYNICGLIRPGTYRRNKKGKDRKNMDHSSDEETDETDSEDEDVDMDVVVVVEDAKIDPEQQLCKSAIPALHYAAFHGLSHITTSLHAVESVQGLRNFFESKLLNWIELMGWYREVRIVMGSVHDLKTCIEAMLSSTELLSVNDVQWCKDIIGMVQPFQATIERSPMQIYFSALAFEPTTSNIACWYHPHFAGSIPRLVLGTRSAQRQSLVLTGHDYPVNAVAFSPDGSRLASASSDSTVRLWDPNTGAAIAELVGHTHTVSAISFSPDGRYLSSASRNETAKVWDVSTGAAVRTLAGHNPANCIAFSIDGQQLALGYEDGSVQVRDVGTSAAVCTLTGHTRAVRCITFSPNGQQLASASDDSTVRIWDAGTGALVRTLAGHTEAVFCVAFSLNGQQLASGSLDKMVQMWDAGTGASARALAGHADLISCVAFSPNGQQLASGSWDNTVKIWDVSIGVEVQTFSFTNHVRCVAFSPKGHQLASGLQDGTVQVWDASTRGAVHGPATQTTSISYCAFSPSGLQLATASEDGTVWFWDSCTGVPIGSPLRHSDGIRSMDYCEWQGAPLLVITHFYSYSAIVWNMSVTPPSRLSTGPPPRLTPSRSLFKVDCLHNWTSIPPAGISFHLPSSFYICAKFLPARPDPYISHEGRIAYIGEDGSVVLVDCSHLLPNSSAK